MNTKNTQDLNNTREWAIALGILLIILGILAIVTLPSILGILAIAFSRIPLRSMTVLLSLTFLVTGLIRIILTIQTQRAKGVWLKLILSILYFAVSILLWHDIIGSVFPLRLGLGIAIFIEGVFEVFLAFRLRPKSSWTWLLLLKGMATIILGISIWSENRFTDFGILVLLPGISLLTTGLWTIVFSQAIALQLDTPSLALVEENEALVTSNVHKSC